GGASASEMRAGRFRVGMTETAGGMASAARVPFVSASGADGSGVVGAEPQTGQTANCCQRWPRAQTRYVDTGNPPGPGSLAAILFPPGPEINTAGGAKRTGRRADQWSARRPWASLLVDLRSLRPTADLGLLDRGRGGNHRRSGGQFRRGATRQR